MSLHKLAMAAFSLASFTTFVVPTSAANADITIYSTRQEFLLAPLLSAFTQETGIGVETVFLKSGIVERIRQEGALTAADVILTTDIGRLEVAREAGVLAQIPTNLAGLDRVPAHLRHEDSRWVALTQRARVAYVSAQSDVESLTYQEIATRAWGNPGLCIRNAQHVYNIGLVAGFLSHYGEAATVEWLEGLRDNLARKPDGNDRAQIKGIGAGECGIGLSNSYYYGVMQSDPQQAEQAAQAKLLFPSFRQGDENFGTHINISGIGLVTGSDAADEALAFIRFMLSEQAQSMYAEMNHEYPVIPGVEPSALVASWGTPTFDRLDLTTLAKNRVLASELIDDVGLND